MEALLERKADVESWNDERLDELSRRMDAGFEKAAAKEEMKLRFDEVGNRFSEITSQLAHINDRLDRQHNTLLIGVFSVIAALVANGIFG